MQDTPGQDLKCSTTGNQCKGCCHFCRSCERADGAAAGCWVGIAIGALVTLAGVMYLGLR